MPPPDPEPTPPPVPPAPPHAAPPAPPAPPTGEDAPPERDPKWLPMRLQQHERSTLKKLGLDSVEAAQQRLARAKELEDQEEARKTAAMTELDREKTARQKAEADLATEKAARERADQQARLTAACAEHGVKNTAYARYLLDEVRRTEPAITEQEAIAKFLKDDAQRAALGLPPVAPVPTPTNTAPPLPGTPPSPTPGAQPNGAPPPFNAATATPAEWQAWQRQNGII